ncbi:hypothetical protein CBM2586_A11012 [Cupriavidus phytorum]|uniref:Uncharacterized protein n=1 Tax=Cupriavidus taiwanensis TaxID=164546 RepID=A0A975ZWJ0_9BURK|nr:hypothetical protein CBM2586_A11012 [Cupriavidus taiwanensis]
MRCSLGALHGGRFKFCTPTIRGHCTAKMPAGPLEVAIRCPKHPFAIPKLFATQHADGSMRNKSGTFSHAPIRRCALHNSMFPFVSMT